MAVCEAALFPEFRPPAEADAVVVGVTSGCSHNACAFCGMYRRRSYHARTLEEFRAHLARARQLFPASATRVFLGDGDAMAVDAEHLLACMAAAREFFPNVRRFGIYARAEGILAKSDSDLQRLAAAGLRVAYLGLESGDAEVLQRVGKGCTVGEMIAAVHRAQAAGIKMSVMALVGLAGREGTARHADATAMALNEMNPRFINLLTYIPVPDTPLWHDIRSGRLTALDDREALMEICRIVAGLECCGSLFRADHASNPLPLAGNLPRDKQSILTMLQATLAGRLALRPRWLRGL